MNSKVVGARLSLAEYEQLLAKAREEEACASELIREALYYRYRIGSLTQTQPAATHPSLLTPP